MGPERCRGCAGGGEDPTVASAGAGPSLPAADAIASLRERLLAWYDRRQRALPWRRRTSLYGTWVSEIMLQQTTVAAVVPAWERFLARFADVRALAAADEQEVLALWSGLGYYRRARALHAAARRVVTDRGGRLPHDRAGWRELPGVGDYTAAAIASIGLGEPVAAVDANVRRVVCRWLCADPAAAAALQPRLVHAAQALLDPRRPGDWNQAVMELGATVCRAARPDCAACPVQPRCRAGSAGTAAAVPAPRARVVATEAWLVLVLAIRGDAVALLPPDAPVPLRAAGAGRPVRRDFSTLHGGLWGLPASPWYPSSSVAEEEPGRRTRATPAWEMALDATRVWLRGRLEGARPPEPVGCIRHAITRYRLEALVVLAMLGPGADPPRPALLVPLADLRERPLSTLAHKALALRDLVPSTGPGTTT
ncbi:MAG: A/G-specific adenine glycosylase [Candidatus Krumholzibacteriia bacterium]